jgi:LAO/AO transport system kinase
MTRRPRLPAAAQALVAGDRRALARAITAVEDGEPGADAVLKSLFARTGHAAIVGVAGPLGVGKSSLINALVGYLRARGRPVGVVAVDPSSPFTGGSVLGDRIRLERSADDTGVFFRSMASRGSIGGVASATRDVVRLLEAAGFATVLVETVGSGQVDVAIHEVATTRVVVTAPHLGDEVQTLKAGLFEIADIFCVNKSDLPGADVAERDLAELAALGTSRDGWRPTVVRTSAVAPSGIEELWSAVEAHEAYRARSGDRRAAERRRLAAEIVDRVRDRVAADLARSLDGEPELARLLDRVVDRSLDPRTAAELVLAARARRR